ncbi:amino acid permease [Neobacillus sp. DY30]|uniref:amino acid permease n=1 Tax=Neobacillus sp. DY30 TaxID=3047871 RepID=UPI0024BFDC59|nr:amino acid permease [Neobacillus sp. DY30]WHY03174.1 amino acid permease [Neobacillus sp. DY30]
MEALKNYKNDQNNQKVQNSDESKGHVKRSLKARHMTMIAIGGSIGTGLFLSTGSSIQTAGPGGALIAYGVIGIMVYFLMTSLGEMATLMPFSGSFSTYGSRFVDPAFGFALGWNYWFNWAVTLAVEIVASAIIMKFWFPDVPSIVWSTLFLGLIFLLNALSVKSYGESEYWFSLIKVVTIIVFIGVGLLTIFGILGGQYIGFKNFTVGHAPVNGGLFSVLSIFLIAGFSFQGTELVGIAAGESENPEKNVPRAIRQVFWRILLFYIVAIAVIGLIIPYTSPDLLSRDVDNIAVSPFTLVFEKVGIAFAASVMNAVILTSVLSAGTSGLYASTRMLWSMAKDGQAPKFLQNVNDRGIPMNALVITTIIGGLAFLTSIFGDQVYTWLLNASGLTGFIAWLGIAVSHYRFRKAYIAQGRDMNDLKFKAKWFPLGPILAFAMCVIVIFGQNYQAFLTSEIDWYGVAVSYIGLPIFLGLWLGYKLVHKTKVVPLNECSFDEMSSK